MANNPINDVDPSGFKSYLCFLAGAGLLPGHQYIKIVNSRVGTYTAGFHPVGGWTQGKRTVSDPNLWVPGEVRHDETGGVCLKVSDDDNFDCDLMKAIEKVEKEKHMFNFRKFNCSHWIQRIISALGE